MSGPLTSQNQDRLQWAEPIWCTSPGQNTQPSRRSPVTNEGGYTGCRRDTGPVRRNCGSKRGEQTEGVVVESEENVPSPKRPERVPREPASDTDLKIRIYF